jgi:hypothetical protein
MPNPGLTIGAVRGGSRGGHPGDPLDMETGIPCALGNLLSRPAVLNMTEECHCGMVWIPKDHPQRGRKCQRPNSRTSTPTSTPNPHPRGVTPQHTPPGQRPQGKAQPVVWAPPNITPPILTRQFHTPRRFTPRPRPWRGWGENSTTLAGPLPPMTWMWLGKGRTHIRARRARGVRGACASRAWTWVDFLRGERISERRGRTGPHKSASTPEADQRTGLVIKLLPSPKPLLNSQSQERYLYKSSCLCFSMTAFRSILGPSAYAKNVDSRKSCFDNKPICRRPIFCRQLAD